MPVAVVIGMVLCGCSGGGSKQNSTAKQAIFTPPSIPHIITDPKEQAAYLADHFWDAFDFADTALVANNEITEQAFVNYLTVLPYAPLDKAESSLTALINSAAVDSTALARFTEMAEHYLYDPNSPYRNEELYIPVLRAVIANKQIDDLRKIRPRYQLDMALKNRPGAIATDFAITQQNGRTIKLLAISADYTILFFNSPDCHDCARVKQMLGKISDSRVRIVAVYPDEDVELWRNTSYPASWINGRNSSIQERQLYDLRAMPTLYLLDKNKRILLKDAPIEVVLDWLKNIN